MQQRGQANQILTNIPNRPGVYQFFNSKDEVLYVGKAKNLKHRIRSYFQAKTNHSDRIKKMIRQIANIKYTIVNNETESLVLEKNFIKEYKPKYNVLLRDDKNYLFIKINYTNQIPTIETERKITDNRSLYFGPYTSTQNVKQTLRFIRQIFPYCANKKITHKPCFFYHLGKCPGICIGKIKIDEYQQTLNKIASFLRGQHSQLITSLTTQMKALAKKQKFEKAKILRDQIQAIEKTWIRQTIIFPKKISWDVFSIFQTASVACINLFIIRDGKLIRKENFLFNNASDISPGEILSNFLPRYYFDASSAPDEIISLYNLRDQINNKTIKAKFNKTIKTTVPLRGQKAKLLAMGKTNAEEYLRTALDNKALEDVKIHTSLKQLQSFLALPALPSRIECYDISNTSGTNATGSMVVFNFGRPDKSQYRKFKIKTKSTPDDFAMMREVLTRRFQHSIQNSKLKIKNSSIWPLPDLIIVDGGKGQLSAAKAAISNSQFLITKQISNSKFQIPIIALAKKMEEVFIPTRKTPLILPPNSPSLFLLQRIRDEAHRFALKYHRHLRNKKMLNKT